MALTVFSISILLSEKISAKKIVHQLDLGGDSRERWFWKFGGNSNYLLGGGGEGEEILGNYRRQFGLTVNNTYLFFVVFNIVKIRKSRKQCKGSWRTRPSAGPTMSIPSSNSIPDTKTNLTRPGNRAYHFWIPNLMFKIKLPIVTVQDTSKTSSISLGFGIGHTHCTRRFEIQIWVNVK